MNLYIDKKEKNDKIGGREHLLYRATTHEVGMPQT